MRSYEEFRNLFPKLYAECSEVNTFSWAQYNMLIKLNEMYLSLKNNQFILTAESEGLAEYEKMLGIPVDPSEDIEFRRERILARLQTLPPFTFNYLRMRLDEFIGPGSWEAWIDFDKYTLYIQSYVVQKWYHEFMVMMNMIKPANIVFVNMPITPVLLDVENESRMSILNWNYILGRWKIDNTTPFAYYDEGEIINMASEPAATSFLLTTLAADIIDLIHHVVLSGDGNTRLITIFDIKQNDNNVAVLGYRVYPQHIPHIEHISINDEAGNVLFEFDADIYVTVDNIIRHIITVQEVLEA